MPAHNAALHVQEAVASIRDQTFEDFELIVIDDGSTDTTAEVCRQAIAGDWRCRLLSRPNTGIVGALNDGFAVSCGADYIARMDADDVAEPARFERQVHYLDANADCVAVGCQVLSVDPEGWPIGYCKNPLDHTEIEDLLFLGQGGALSHPAVMIRRGAFEQVRGYDPRFSLGEEIDLYLRLGEIGRLANLPDVLLRYRLHFGSWNALQARKQHRSVQAVVDEARERRGLGAAPPLSIEYPANAAELRARWGYSAVAAGNHRTALKHAIRCVAARPWKPAWWRLLGAATKGLILTSSHSPTNSHER
jgi:glycosyltransferase involved in cell wall biosynthesis